MPSFFRNIARAALPLVGTALGGPFGGALGGLAGNLLGGGGRSANQNDTPANAAMEFAQRIPAHGTNAYNPFIQQGQEAGQQLFPIEEEMGTNPFNYYNNIMRNYRPSPGYQYRQGQLNQGAHNTAAAGGFAGTENDARNRSELTNALMGEDMQQYLQNILGIQGAGLSGINNRVERGYGASGSLADYLGGAHGAMGNIASYGARDRQLGRQDRRNETYSQLAGLLGPINQNMQRGGSLRDLFSGGMFNGGFTGQGR